MKTVPRSQPRRSNLTDRGVAAIRAESKRFDVWDTNLPGFGLRVSPSGHKTFMVMYRAANGIQRRQKLGAYPLLTLSQARQAAKVVLGEVAKGHDPAGAKQVARTAATIEDLAKDFVERHSKVRKRSWREDERILSRYVIPAWKGRRVSEISRHDVRQLVEAISERRLRRSSKCDAKSGAPVMANRVRSLLSTLFQFAIERDYREDTPFQRIPKQPETRRDRVLRETEIAAFWQATTALEKSVAAALRFMLLTGQRHGEVLDAEWSEVDFETATWTIPATKAKNKQEHAVPLSAEAVGVLRTVRTDLGRWVFVSPRKRQQQPLRTVQKAVERMRRDLGFEFRAHDLRRTAATCMAMEGTSPTVIGKLLNHSDSSVTAIYNRYAYLPEMRVAVQRWGALVAKIVDPERPTSLATAV